MLPNSGVNVLSTLIPAAAISGVGFAFKDYPAVWNALDGKFGAHLRGQIDQGRHRGSRQDLGQRVPDDHEQRRPISQPDDLRGMKIRVPVSALWLSLFKSLGAAPTGMNFAEVYTALQTKVVDGQENPPAIIAAAKLNEVQKYCLGHEPYVGRLVVPDQPPRLEPGACTTCRRRSPRSSTTPASPSARTSRSRTSTCARTSPQPG